MKDDGRYGAPQVVRITMTLSNGEVVDVAPLACEATVSASMEFATTKPETIIGVDPDSSVTIRGPFTVWRLALDAQLRPGDAQKIRQATWQT